jgi:hypothetical protein
MKTIRASWIWLALSRRHAPLNGAEGCSTSSLTAWHIPETTSFIVPRLARFCLIDVLVFMVQGEIIVAFESMKTLQNRTPHRRAFGMSSLIPAARLLYGRRDDGI